VHVLIPDLRGHGSSGGLSTLGVEEPLDVAAAVAAAPPDLPVVTLGISLGGAAVLLHAGARDVSRRGVAGVIAISPPAWSGTWDTPGTKRVARYARSPVGRQVLARLLRTRIAAQCGTVPDSRHLVAGIAPAFTLIVADPADHYFGEEHSRALYEWAQEPKDLWLLPGTGHGTDLLSPALALRLLRELEERLSPDGRPAG
jgi:pimeloyl-ACP methyl ester carboxylesterase